MSDDLKLKPDLILNPQTGDIDSAGEILDELFEVLKKHNCALVHQDACMVLGKVMGFGEKLRVIAHVRQITPDFIEWKAIDWSRMLKVQ